MKSLDSLLAEYLKQAESGSPPDQQAMLAAHPEHADELRSFFANHQWIAQADDDLEVDLTGTQIGNYVLHQRIARGGMGVVYRARQVDLNRDVAIKLIGDGTLASQELRKRFRIESAAAARMQHPNIVPIYEVGSWEGHAYFTMAFVEGPPLQSHVDAHDLTAQQAAERVMTIARAVHYAHQQGVIHRDLKPDNILLDAAGQPMLTDFGLAKWHRDGTLLTRTGQVLGTPHYMSPEQATGRGDAGPAADIYALGAILYALLTGGPPHSGDSPAEVLQNVITCDPDPPREVNSDIPVPLEAICMRCLECEPTDRYASAAELADELLRFLDGQATRTRPDSLWRWFSKALARDQHQSHFRNWGRALFLMGWVIFLAHAAIFALRQTALPGMVAFWLPRITMFMLLLAIIYFYRSGVLVPRSVAERPLWSIWIGYVLTLATMNVLLLMGGISTDALFPVAATLSGFGFMAMAGHVWGMSMVIGAGFHLVAMLMLLLPRFAPLLLGSMWLLGMGVLSRRYRRSQAT